MSDRGCRKCNKGLVKSRRLPKLGWDDLPRSIGYKHHSQNTPDKMGIHEMREKSNVRRLQRILDLKHPSWLL
jgi:hypothetical protein